MNLPFKLAFDSPLILFIFLIFIAMVVENIYTIQLKLRLRCVTPYFATCVNSEMPSENSQLVLCYNKGCGAKFDPNDNKEDSCTFHPGNPVFHDAYKGWSCCNKKCTDFTEFLNIQGCKKSFHSNVKPPQPERPVVDKSKADEVIEYKAPVPKLSEVQRPPFESPLTKMKPEISSLLKAQMENLVIQQKGNETSAEEISIGTTCKNGGCKASYQGPHSVEDDCNYHPGIPVFHEGLKFWSCCNKKTTDFAAFLEQAGCKTGTHLWVKEKVDKKSGNTQAVCRYDWHQTGSHSVISVYAKKYCPIQSTVELNPIRAKVHLYFPEDDTYFDKDLELFGVIDVEKSHVGMLQTKIEIKMKKAEPGSWAKLDIPKISTATVKEPEQTKTPLAQPIPDVDLSDVS